MAARPTTIISVPDTTISRKTPHAANATNASVSVLAAISETQFPTDTAVSANAADARCCPTDA